MQGQSYVLLEGLCNNDILGNPEDKMALRLMDELFRIEKKLGEVVGIVALQSHIESEFIREDELEYEEFPEPEVVEEPKKKSGDEEEEEEEEPPEEEEGDEPKVPEFKPEEYKWTKSDRQPKSLPVLYVQNKGTSAYHDVKNADNYSNDRLEAVSKCLDDFCTDRKSVV